MSWTHNSAHGTCYGHPLPPLKAESRMLVSCLGDIGRGVEGGVNGYRSPLYLVRSELPSVKQRRFDFLRLFLCRATLPNNSLGARYVRERSSAKVLPSTKSSFPASKDQSRCGARTNSSPPHPARPAELLLARPPCERLGLCPVLSTKKEKSWTG